MCTYARCAVVEICLLTLKQRFVHVGLDDFKTVKKDTKKLRVKYKHALIDEQWTGASIADLWCHKILHYYSLGTYIIIVSTFSAS